MDEAEFFPVNLCGVSHHGYSCVLDMCSLQGQPLGIAEGARGGLAFLVTSVSISPLVIPAPLRFWGMHPGLGGRGDALAEAVSPSFGKWSRALG